MSVVGSPVRGLREAPVQVFRESQYEPWEAVVRVWREAQYEHCENPWFEGSGKPQYEPWEAQYKRSRKPSMSVVETWT